MKIISNTAPLPATSELAVNLLSAVVDETKAIVAQRPKVTEEERDKRMDVCKSCDRFLLDQSRCSACGCFMEVKTRFRSAQCPLGKW
jgi:hypothetical protein